MRVKIERDATHVEVVVRHEVGTSSLDIIVRQSREDGSMCHVSHERVSTLYTDPRGNTIDTAPVAPEDRLRGEPFIPNDTDTYE